MDEALEHLRDAVEGLPSEALAWRPPGRDTNPITVLVVHSLHSTRWWLSIARGLPLPDRDRPSEFESEVGSDAELLSFLDGMAAECRERLDAPEPFDPGAKREPPDDEPVSAAWALMHALEHLSEHAAQAQLTRGLWEAR
jgi:hypothetical protein